MHEAKSNIYFLILFLDMILWEWRDHSRYSWCYCWVMNHHQDEVSSEKAPIPGSVLSVGCWSHDGHIRRGKLQGERTHCQESDWSRGECVGGFERWDSRDTETAPQQCWYWRYSEGFSAWLQHHAWLAQLHLHSGSSSSINQSFNQSASINKLNIFSWRKKELGLENRESLW